MTSGFARRQLLAGLAALPFATKAQAIRASNPPQRRIIRLKQGRAEGLVTGDLLALKGIPFAKPPIGPLRFRPPQPLPAWQGLLDASAFRDAPIQLNPLSGISPRDFLGAERSEDCLYLNIWSPLTPGPHPVFVWVHGGANEGGAASQRPFAGSAFAQAGIVCVTVGYRTGILGFLELGGLLGQDYRESGSNGLMDIVAALRWVRDNIGDVGGDPDRITLGGQSAGAKNVGSLIASRRASGLFQSAIMQSGGQTVHDLGGADSVARLAERVLGEGGRTAGDLLTMPAIDLLPIHAAIRKVFDRPFPFRAVVGSSFLPQSPVDAMQAGAGRNVRLLIGSNTDESIMFLNPRMIGKPLVQRELANIDVADAGPVFQHYAEAFPGLSPLALRVKFLTAEEYAYPSLSMARIKSSSGAAPVWLYRFDQPAAAGPFKGWATHSGELPFVWDALRDPLLQRFFGPPTEQAFALGREMHRRWCAFISGNSPEGTDGPAWPSFGSEEQEMRFGVETGAIPLDQRESNLWRKSGYLAR